MKKILLLTTLITLLSISTKASHNLGGEITYEYIGANSYQITAKLYTDCQGVPPGNSININYSSVSCSINQFVSLSKIYTKDISQVCDTMLLACNGGSLQGIYETEYQGVINVLNTCNDWILSYSLCCRGNSTNSPSISSNFYIETKFNNTIATVNKSPYFADSPRWMIPVNGLNYINAGAYDRDGDSLYYSLVAPKSSTTVPLTYNAGYSINQPFGGLSTTIDSKTGIITTLAPTVGQFILCVQVDEYRAGILISSTKRDFTTNVYVNPNSLPEITNASLSFNKCVNDSLSVNLFSSDNTDTITTSILYPFPNNVNVPIFSNTTAPLNQNTNYLNDTNTLSWDLTGTLPNKEYIIYVNVEDHQCPISHIQSYAVVVNISSCDSVWPGDANSNFVANVHDILPIGVYYNIAGPVRTGATINWNAEFATDWGTTQASNTDIKHVDCNGDGTIDANDTTAILLNYGLMHSKGGPSSAMAGINDPNLYVDITLDTIATSTGLAVPVKLGTAVTQADSIYGIAMTITYDPNLIDSIAGITVDYSNSWLGNKGVDMITIDTNFYDNGQIDIGIVRTDGQMMSGFGEILTLNIITIDNLSGKTTLYESLIFDFVDVEIIDNKEDLRLFNQQLDSIIIKDETTGISEKLPKNHVSIIPNPNTGNFKVYVEDYKDSNIEVYNTVGQLIETKTNLQDNFTTFNIGNLNKGIYFIQVHNKNKASTIEKVIIQ